MRLYLIWKLEHFQPVPLFKPKRRIWSTLHTTKPCCKIWMRTCLYKLEIKQLTLLLRQKFILGVIFDSGLHFQSHVARACKYSTNAVLALKRLKTLRPETTPQLFSSTVAPVINYAYVIWALGGGGAGSQQPCRQLPTRQTRSSLALQDALLVWREWSCQPDYQGGQPCKWDTMQTNE